jgi:hypothetical protein
MTTDTIKQVMMVHDAFRLNITTHDDTYIMGFVEEVTAWGEDGDNEYEVYIWDLYLKWDQCFHFSFGENKDGGGYLHICGKENVQRHNQLMNELLEYARKHIASWYEL